MGLLSRVLITAAMIGLSAGQSHAAASGMADAPKPETFKQLAQGFEGGLFGGPCPSGQFLACWTEPYGRRFCGC